MSPDKPSARPVPVSGSASLSRQRDQEPDFLAFGRRKSLSLQSSSLSPSSIKSQPSAHQSPSFNSAGAADLHSTIPSSNNEEYSSINKQSSSVGPATDDSLLTKKVLSTEKNLSSTHDNQGKNQEENLVDLVLTPFQVESKLRSYGPYIRIYDQSAAYEAISTITSLKSSSVLAASEPARFYSHSSTKQSLAKQHQQIQQRSSQFHDTNASPTMASSPSKVDIDVSPLKINPSRRKHEHGSGSGSSVYPSAIAVPPGMKKVIAGKSTDTHNFYQGRSVSNILTLSRPTSSQKSSKYGRISNSSGISRTELDGYLSITSRQNPEAVDPWVPQLPFLEITNSLRLYLKMQVFDDQGEEKILAWVTGSVVFQILPFVKGDFHASPPSLVSFLSLFNMSSSSKQKEEEKRGFPDYYLIERRKPPPFQPGYLLVTSKFIYLCRPLFNLASLSDSSLIGSEIPSTYFDQQTKYSNPAHHFSIIQKIALEGQNSIRVDVGPGRQYLAFHAVNHKSLVFCTRSRLETMKIIEALTASLDIHFSFPSTNLGINSSIISSPLTSSSPSTSVTGHSGEAMAVVGNRQQAIIQLNQNVEWAMNYLQRHILIQGNEKGKNVPKSARILSYYSVWPSEFGPLQMELETYEYDRGVEEQVSPVDFAFIRCYIQSAFLRYFKPVAGVEKRGVEILSVALVSSREYLYVVQEALEVWPPPVFPPESISTAIQPILSERQGSEGGHATEKKKGLIADRVPPFTLLGVGRIRQLTRIERWRSWKLNQCHPETPLFNRLGSALQNGVVGYLRVTEANYAHNPSPERQAKYQSRHQQGNSSGFLWWCRIYFGYKEDCDRDESPALPPTIKPTVGYWWDVCFRCRDSCDEFIEVLVKNEHVDQAELQVVYGDD